MNHLAHALLADPAPARRLGNLFGDAIRGPLSRQDLPAGVIEGAREHRQIDGMTDQHPASTRLRGLFAGDLRRYAGIILDVAFDHYLIRHWPAFCAIDRQSFTLDVYNAMHQNPALLPARVRPLASRMIARDFLNRCETLQGVEDSLSLLSNRLSRGFDAAAACRTLERHDSDCERGFLQVFTDVNHALGSGPGPDPSEKEAVCQPRSPSGI